MKIKALLLLFTCSYRYISSNLNVSRILLRAVVSLKVLFFGIYCNGSFELIQKYVFIFHVDDLRRLRKYCPVSHSFVRTICFQ